MKLLGVELAEIERDETDTFWESHDGHFYMRHNQQRPDHCMWVATVCAPGIHHAETGGTPEEADSELRAYLERLAKTASDMLRFTKEEAL